MSNPVSITIPVSAGELIDRITILAIKAERSVDAAQAARVRHELELLLAARDRALTMSPELAGLAQTLQSVNAELWQIEDRLRGCERRGDFGAEFIRLARSVYRCNDRRHELKDSISRLVHSLLGDEKSYAPYRQ